MVKGQFKQARESVSDREEEGFSAMDTSPDEVTHTPNGKAHENKFPTLLFGSHMSLYPTTMGHNVGIHCGLTSCLVYKL